MRPGASVAAATSECRICLADDREPLGTLVQSHRFTARSLTEGVALRYSPTWDRGTMKAASLWGPDRGDATDLGRGLGVMQLRTQAGAHIRVGLADQDVVRVPRRPKCAGRVHPRSTRRDVVSALVMDRLGRSARDLRKMVDHIRQGRIASPRQAPSPSRTGNLSPPTADHGNGSEIATSGRGRSGVVSAPLGPDPAEAKAVSDPEAPLDPGPFSAG